jgi:hypothetical protein
LGRGGREALCGGALGPGAAVDTLGLFLLPTRRPGRRFADTEDEATVEGSFDLFLLPRGRPRPRFSICAPMFRCASPASAMEDNDLEKKTLDAMRKTKTMRRRKLVTKELGFFPKPTCFIYKKNLMGLSKLKVQIHLWAFIFCPKQKIRQRQHINDKAHV